MTVESLMCPTFTVPVCAHEEETHRVANRRSCWSHSGEDVWEGLCLTEPFETPPTLSFVLIVEQLFYGQPRVSKADKLQSWFDIALRVRD